MEGRGGEKRGRGGEKRGGKKPAPSLFSARVSNCLLDQREGGKKKGGRMRPGTIKFLRLLDGIERGGERKGYSFLSILCREKDRGGKR